MTRPDPPLRTFARTTAARPDAVLRVRARVDGESLDDASFHAVLTHLPEPRSGAEQRVLARLDERRKWRVRPALVAGLALAAVLLVALRTLYVPVLPLADGLRADDDWVVESPTKDVALKFRGRGTLAGTSREPRIDWETGTLEVEVTPNRGIDLAVITREAEVRVVGTGFAVTRDALGTRVEVSHGHVAVMCADGQKALLGAGEETTCLPTQPSALLGRAHALADDGADPTLVLDAADRGLAGNPSGPVRTELALVRVETLTRLGRADEALNAANAALPSASGRADDLRRLAARNALVTGGCGAALPYLGVLATDDPAGPELVTYADCIAPSDPEAARTALKNALRAGAPPDQEEGILARLARLPPPRAR
jgi:ferric-dicitrate binding protein FerR (iron transport regulator)